jgi:hypothetical protein
MRRLLILALLLPASAAAQPEPRGPIQDNSFLVEEAYNQEAGVVQHVSTLERRAGGGWAYGFTQEWPLAGQRHQLSFTLPVENAAGPGASTGIADVALHYRYQWLGDGDARLAVAPRATLLLPTGDPGRGRGAGGVGLQGNLPVSLVLAPQWVAHTNVGATYLPAAEDAAGVEAALTSLSAAQSLVWLAHPAVNLLLEVAWSRDEAIVDADETRHYEGFVVSPGVRFAIDLPSGLQIVPGVAVPLGVGPSDGERSLFLYLSLEHAFRRTGP